MNTLAPTAVAVLSDRGNGDWPAALVADQHTNAMVLQSSIYADLDTMRCDAIRDTCSRFCACVGVASLDQSIERTNERTSVLDLKPSRQRIQSTTRPRHQALGRVDGGGCYLSRERERRDRDRTISRAIGSRA